MARKSELADEEKSIYDTSLQAALDAARVRARNALSQALTTLAGLQDLQRLVDGQDSADGSKDSHDGIDYYKYMREFEADWESRAFVARDPIAEYGKDDPVIRARRDEHLQLLAQPSPMASLIAYKTRYQTS